MGQPVDRHVSILSALALSLLASSIVALMVAFRDIRSSEPPNSPTEVLVRSPEIGEYLPSLLDEGRLELATPPGWRPTSRQSDYLAKFVRDNTQLPWIEVTVDPESIPGMQSVTRENVREFAERVAQTIDEEQLLEPVIPMVIGDVPCARYVQPIVMKRRDGNRYGAEMQQLKVLRNGRMYNIDLIVVRHTLTQDRDAAYSVCASMRFHDPEARPSVFGQDADDSLEEDQQEGSDP